uniref:uncharacterized protein LOC120331860 n=1 Tax=Styela clava TaxID=7725 RepID=UPI00193A93E4|nr:uncharacterized protein LOC120331860 [Styela clava]
MESEAFCKFAQVASTTGADVLQFENCNLTREKLNAFAQGATDFGLKIQQLFLDEENFKPSHAIIKNLCQLFSTVEESIDLDGWEIDQQGIDALQSDLIMLNKKLKIRINDVYLQVSTDQHSYSRIQSIKNSIRRIFRRKRR